MHIYIVSVLALAVAGLALSIENPQVVAFGYFRGEVELPLAVLLVAAFGTGALFTLAVVTIESWVRRRATRRAASRATDGPSSREPHPIPPTRAPVPTARPAIDTRLAAAEPSVRASNRNASSS